MHRVTDCAHFVRWLFRLSFLTGFTPTNPSVATKAVEVDGWHKTKKTS